MGGASVFPIFVGDSAADPPISGEEARRPGLTAPARGQADGPGQRAGPAGGGRRCRRLHRARPRPRGRGPPLPAAAGRRGGRRPRPGDLPQGVAHGRPLSRRRPLSRLADADRLDHIPRRPPRRRPARGPRSRSIGSRRAGTIPTRRSTSSGRWRSLASASGPPPCSATARGAATPRRRRIMGLPLGTLKSVVARARAALVRDIGGMR